MKLLRILGCGCLVVTALAACRPTQKGMLSSSPTELLSRTSSLTCAQAAARLKTLLEGGPQAGFEQAVQEAMAAVNGCRSLAAITNEESEPGKATTAGLSLSPTPISCSTGTHRCRCTATSNSNGSQSTNVYYGCATNNTSCSFFNTTYYQSVSCPSCPAPSPSPAPCGTTGSSFSMNTSCSDN